MKIMQDNENRKAKDTLNLCVLIEEMNLDSRNKIEKWK